MAPPPRTPRRQYGVATEFITPPAQTSLSRELKQVLNERNLLTAKTRKQGTLCTRINIIFDIINMFLT